MISPKSFYEHLLKHDISFFTGVPDSLLKNLCFYISDHAKKRHIIAANEGNAIALAIGYYLSSSKVPMIYLQNSGLGNIINPLLSLADKDVYSIPMLLVIGWRGKPGVKDEPQHKKQGRVMLSMLKSMEIEFEIIRNSDSRDQIKTKINRMIKRIKIQKMPCAVVIEKDVFKKYNKISKKRFRYELSREDALHIILENIRKDSIIVSTTGFTSRELYEYRKNNCSRNPDFYTVGGMGHASQIALGISINKKKEVICLDGDGSVLMHMGSLAINASINKKNYKHIVFNNGAHESVGNQPTVGFDIDMSMIAKYSGYSLTLRAHTKTQVIKAIKKILEHKGTAFLEVLVKSNTRSDLSRPDKTPIENKKQLMSLINK